MLVVQVIDRKSTRPPVARVQFPATLPRLVNGEAHAENHLAQNQPTVTTQHIGTPLERSSTRLTRNEGNSNTTRLGDDAPLAVEYLIVDISPTRVFPRAVR